ncbi:hypothetical protein AAVH_10010 [Aphelenchoides avenae]|nr:hypothetical protein AAVH_10010 [Aphelenchus avenae]
MRTFILAFASVTLIAIVCTGDWAGCPEGTEFDGWADIVSNSPCYNGGVRSDSEYTKGTLPYPVCCAPAGRSRRAAFLKEAEDLSEKPKTKGTLQFE